MHTWQFGREATHWEGHHKGQQATDEESDPPGPHPPRTVGGNADTVKIKGQKYLTLNICMIRYLLKFV